MGRLGIPVNVMPALRIYPIMRPFQRVTNKTKKEGVTLFFLQLF